jgi:hypothetical protein
MGRCNCDSGCQCVIHAGTDITVAGTGSVDSPYVISVVLVSPDGTHYRITVANDGTLSTVAI